MRVAEIPHDEWEQKKDQSIEEVLKSVARKPKPEAQPGHDDDENTGLEWIDPEHPDATLVRQLQVVSRKTKNYRSGMT